jgi:hypothetical protein
VEEVDPAPAAPSREHFVVAEVSQVIEDFGAEESAPDLAD